MIACGLQAGCHVGFQWGSHWGYQRHIFWDASDLTSVSISTASSSDASRSSSLAFPRRWEEGPSLLETEVPLPLLLISLSLLFCRLFLASFKQKIRRPYRVDILKGDVLKGDILLGDILKGDIMGNFHATCQGSGFKQKRKTWPARMLVI